MVLPGLVLAAGSSSRMGTVKALLEVRGEPLLLRAVRLLREAGAAPVVTVLGHHAERLRPLLEESGASWVANPDPDQGQLSSLLVGLEALEERVPGGALPGFLLLPVDHALVQPATVVRVVEAVREDPTRFAVPSVAMRRGHPSWFPAEALPELRDPTLEGGARTVLRRRGEAVRHLVVEDPGARLDCDTPEDWEAARPWRT